MSARMFSSKRINWNLLHTFVILGETESVSRTAQLLGRGQPAVSAALKKLEEQVGYPLAERGPRFFRLTEAGKLLYREACEIYGAVDRISALLKEAGDVLTGNLTLTIASHMTSPIIDQSLADFHRRHPKVTLSINVANGLEMMHALSNRLIHFGIGPVWTQAPDLEYIHIFREHCGFYCGPGHRLFGRAGLTVADLENETAITYRSAVYSDTLQSIVDMHNMVRFAEPILGISNNLEEVRRMIVAGIGVGAIPVQIAARDVRDGLLWRLPPYGDVMPIDVYLMLNPKVRPSRSEAAYIEMLRATIRSIPIEKRTYCDAALP